MQRHYARHTRLHTSDRCIITQYSACLCVFICLYQSNCWEKPFSSWCFILEMHHEANTTVLHFKIWCNHLQHAVNNRNSKIKTEMASGWYDRTNCCFTKLFSFRFYHHCANCLLKTPHHLPLAADLCCCVFTPCRSAPSRQQYDFLKKRLSICWAIVVMPHCDWLSCFRAMRPWCGWLRDLLITTTHYLYSSPISLALCAAAHTWTKTAGALGDAHSHAVCPGPTTLHLSLPWRN